MEAPPTTKMAELAVSGSADGASAPKSFARRDHLIDMQKRVQAKWKEGRTFEADPIPGKKKYLATFPYPYMNGRLHLGHGFTMTKADFAVGYHKMKGENAIFPYGFHCSGMPIQAAANKLKAELEQFGCPPKFPKQEEEGAEETVAQAKAEGKPAEGEQNPGTFKGKKSKAVAKTGAVKYQWDILKMMVPEELIPNFVDPVYWLHYFPPLGREDLELFGFHVDLRRAFITTSVNPYYDSFIRWQFHILREKKRVLFGTRPAVYSALDGQVCADHDRASGEGVGPQEYTLIKLRIVEPFPAKLAPLAGKKVFLVAATLRPETMYGQTNCFVLPDGDYGAFQIDDEEIFVCSERSALNLAHQNKSRVWGKVECLLKLKGWDLLGAPLSAPNATYEVVYTLPLLTISMKKGTGVVTSVPSDAPDDYAALRDLKEKPAMRQKFHLEDHMVLPYEVVPIIDIPGYGDKAAVTVCDELKIKSQNDTEKLKEAKEKVYLKGFYEGRMLVGSQKGQKVCDAKPLVRKELIAAGLALPYFEPESTVMSRSGDECVVALTEQWYLAYGEEDWKERVLKHIKSEKFTTYNPVVLSQFEATLSWLHEWACSRQFGLGTHLPWDEKWVIESLSDSTIYMAYYTVAHHLQGNMEGSAAGPLGIMPEELTLDVWNYIFLKAPYPENCSIPKEKLDVLKSEFNYWYPLDLRVSGKDLIQNHLTMSLYNHTEIWSDDPSKWPRSFFTNGHILVDAEKMSKQKGNFIMLKDAVEIWGADATRIALADAGDGMDDANFARDTANAAILRLTTEEDWIKSVLEEELAGQLRSGEVNLSDRIFENEVNKQVEDAQTAYDNMRFRDALHAGFFELLLARDFYRDVCTRQGMGLHVEVTKKFIDALVRIMAPITPHWCENVWGLLGNKESVFKAGLPATQQVDSVLFRAGNYFRANMKKFRDSVIKASQPKKAKKGQPAEPAKPPTKAYLYVATAYPEWKEQLMTYMRSIYDPTTRGFPQDFMKLLKQFVDSKPELKKLMKLVMQFAAFQKSEVEAVGVEALDLVMPFNEMEVLQFYQQFLASSLGLQEVQILTVPGDHVPGPEDKQQMAEPGKPYLFTFWEYIRHKM